jgi:hypothetical protein
MSDDLYRSDIVTWSEQQARLLRRAARYYRASMRQHLDLAALYEDALLPVRLDVIDGIGPRPLPPACPFTLDDLLCEQPDPIALTRRFAVSG